MNQHPDNWVHLFEISNIGKHKDGFTLYEVISMIYPSSCPDALTKMVVWKRYNDFKVLHSDVKKKHKTLKINDKMPKLLKDSYFKRFADRVIEARRKCALTLLEYVGKHPALFTSDCFVKFFEASYVPVHQIKGNIDSIRSDLQLPNPPDVISVNSLSSEDEINLGSDTESISTRSITSISIHSQGTDVQSIDSLNHQKSDTVSIESSDSETSKVNKVIHSEKYLPSIPESNTETVYSNNSISVFSTPPQTSDCFEISKASNLSELQYMYEAAKHVTAAAEYESNREFEKAFTSYKLGIGCLLNGIRDDPDLDRRQIVRHKTAKYLLRAEKIYNIHLNPDIDHFSWNDDVSKKIADSLKIERPVHELNDIKIIDIIDSSVMLVKYSRDGGLYVVKAIRKYIPHVCSRETPIMPSNIPFMVRLYKYFCTNDTIFVLLQHARGGKLWDYLHNSEHLNEYISSKTKFLNVYDETNDVLPSPLNESIEESDKSYSELIEEYQMQKQNPDCKSKEDSHEFQESDCACNESDMNTDSVTEVDTEASPDQTQDIVQNSHKLLRSVDQVLIESRKTGDDILDYVCSIVENDDDSNIKTDNLNLLTDITSLENYCDKDTFLTIDCWSDEVIKHWEPSANIKVVRWAAQLLLALESLHRLGIICYDLQPKNLLLDENGDLLLSYMYYWEESEVVRCPQFPKNMYTAPEINTFGRVTKSCDWWSYGVILYEMLTGLVFYQCHPGGTYTALNIPKYISPNAYSLLTQLLIYSAEERLGSGFNGVEDIKAHPFFDAIDWRTMIQR